MIFITNPIQCIDYKRVICISLTNYPIELTSRTIRSFSLCYNFFTVETDKIIKEQQLCLSIFHSLPYSS